MACHHRSPDRDRRYLRDELQEHAGTAMGIWLFHRRRTDPSYLRGAVLAVPARRMVVSSRPADPVQSVNCFDFGTAQSVRPIRYIFLLKAFHFGGARRGSRYPAVVADRLMSLWVKSGHVQCKRACLLYSK